jgi:hypothetical protein
MIKRKIIVSQLLYCPLIIVWFQQIILLSIDYCFISTYRYLDIFLNYQKSDPQIKKASGIGDLELLRPLEY